MARKIRVQAEDLAEELSICELEMRRSRTFRQRLDAFEEFERAVDRIAQLRHESESLHVGDLEPLFERLDALVLGVTRSRGFRAIDWIAKADLRWYCDPPSVGTEMC